MDGRKFIDEQGSRLRAEGEKLRAEGERLKAEGRRLRQRGRRSFTPQRNIINAARLLSLMTDPFYLPVLGLLLLFTLSYLNMLPLAFRLQVLLMVYLLTALVPRLLIRAYRRYHGWTPWQLGYRERRMVPYIISVSCYMLCVWLMHLLHIPHFMGAIVTAALVVQMVCLLVNIWWKISIHTASIGGVAGALMFFALIFGFNPVGWLALCFILAGILGTSRMLLRQHTLGQVVGGFLAGVVACVGGLLIA